MAPVNEPTTTASSIVLSNNSMSSPPDLLALATVMANQSSNRIELLNKIHQMVVSSSIPDKTPPTTIVGVSNLPSYDISALLTSYLSNTDPNTNLPPSVGSPPNPSSSLCSEPTSSQSQQNPTHLMQAGPSMAQGTTTDKLQHREQEPQKKEVGMMPMTRKYSMEPIRQQVLQPHPLQFLPNHFMATNEVFSTLEMSQKQSPPGIFKIAKNEPSSSSNSQPSTPSMGDRRSVPACSICGTDSTGIHFGVDACAACSAFFRRTVVLNKDYACNKGGNCTVVKDGSAGQKCRACRFRKCINVGMDKNSVQHRRDAIGKYSAGVKRELSPDGEFEPPPKLSFSEASTSQQSAAHTGVPDTPLSPPARVPRVPSNLRAQYNTNREGRKSVLHELICRQTFIIEQRHLFYAGALGDWFRKPSPIENQVLYELTDFSNCMYHLWKIEPRLAADFMNRNSYLDPLSLTEKLKIYRNFVIMRQSVEEPYLTWRHGGLEKKWFVMPNNTYIDFTNPEKYFTNGALKDLKLDYATTTNLFLPSFTHAMDTISEKMKKLEVNETELAALLGLVLLDPGVYGIEETTRVFLKSIRDQLIQDLFAYYEDEMGLPNPEVRIADLFMIVAAIKVHSIKTSENMHMLRVFDLIPADACFNQMLDVESANVSPNASSKENDVGKSPQPMSFPEMDRNEESPAVKKEIDEKTASVKQDTGDV